MQHDSTLKRIDYPLLIARLVTFLLLLSLHDSSTAFDLTMAEPAEVENPEPPRTNKPRRQCHSSSHSTVAGLMSFKFNNVACCFDTIFSD